MKEPQPADLSKLKQIEAEMGENRSSIHGLVQVITGDHPLHGYLVIVSDDTSAFIFATPIPAADA